VREEQVPAVVTPGGFQAHQGFVSRATPELARSLEAALRLPAGGFHRFTAFGLARAAIQWVNRNEFGEIQIPRSGCEVVGKITRNGKIVGVKFVAAPVKVRMIPPNKKPRSHERGYD
jgi:hypothetical protein